MISRLRGKLKKRRLNPLCQNYRLSGRLLLESIGISIMRLCSDSLSFCLIDLGNFLLIFRVFFRYYQRMQGSNLEKASILGSLTFLFLTSSTPSRHVQTHGVRNARRRLFTLEFSCPCSWVKAEWLKNEKYLRLNLQTMLQMNISSVAGLKLRARPPIDWTHQFLLVPDRLDFGTVEYGTISMKVLNSELGHLTSSVSRPRFPKALIRGYEIVDRGQRPVHFGKNNKEQPYELLR